jgi:hypothetical protein
MWERLVKCLNELWNTILVWMQELSSMEMYKQHFANYYAVWSPVESGMVDFSKMGQISDVKASGFFETPNSMGTAEFRPQNNPNKKME